MAKTRQENRLPLRFEVQPSETEVDLEGAIADLTELLTDELLRPQQAPAKITLAHQETHGEHDSFCSGNPAQEVP